MGLFRLIRHGTFLAAAYAVLLYAGEAVFPGTLGNLAFSPLALISAFSMMLLDAAYSLR
ncbi:MAG TPA: hypothetical protein VJH23_06360 [archaeon]|nr:hypothetical protein [archaeon]